jgi:uncharacterized membrane protein
MEQYILIALVAAVLGSGIIVIDKHLVSRIPVRAFVLLIGIFGLLSITLFPLTGTPFPNSEHWLYGIGLGMLFGFIIFSWFRAFRIGEVSRVAPLGIFSTILITVGGIIFFEEALSQRQWIAFGLFLVGGALLSLRLEKQLVFLDPKNIFKVVVTVSDETAKIFKHPVDHSMKVSRQFLRSIEHTTGDITDNLVELLSGKTFKVRARTKIRFARGFWWAAIAVIASVPYALLAKELNTTIDPLSGFIMIRTGVFVFALIMLIDRFKDIKEALKDPHAIGIAAIKEPFAMFTAFLVLLASSIAPLGLVRSVLSLDAAIVLVMSVILARMGFIEESLRRREIVQKTLGVLFLLSGSLTLFL